MSRIQAGEMSPNIKAVTYDGNVLNLDVYLGRKVWLVFYRYAECPLCTYHLTQANQLYEKIAQKNGEVVAVFESPPSRFLSGTKCPIPRFPVIADPEKTLYRLYGIESSLPKLLRPSVLAAFLNAALHKHYQGAIDGSLTTVPAHFLIREDGTVAEAYYGKTAADHIPFWKVKRFFLGAGEASAEAEAEAKAQGRARVKIPSEVELSSGAPEVRTGVIEFDRRRSSSDEGADGSG